MLSFTYHQVMPVFLDFIFPFGRQEYAQDFHFSGFRHETSVTDDDLGLRLPELGRSGREIRLCYSLKSVEPSKGQQHWPWSIRQSAVHHSFDVETRRATWIVVKGDQLMKKRIKSATKSLGLSGASSLWTFDRVFASTLAMHMILCDWCGENWRWYINFLEEQLQARTRRTLSTMVGNLPSPVAEENFDQHGKCSFPIMKGKLSEPGFEKVHIQQLNSVKPPVPASQSLPPFTPQHPVLLDESREQPEHEAQPEFSFNDLQQLQFIEEKVNETLLVLEVNASVLAQLRQCYLSIIAPESQPGELILKWRGDIVQFEKRIANIENDLALQQSRVRTLLRLLADRKSLVGSVIPHI